MTDSWFLKDVSVPSGVKPGLISAGSGRRPPSSSFPKNSLTRQTCPVINCGRVYDNASLLDGHLKRSTSCACAAVDLQRLVHCNPTLAE